MARPMRALLSCSQVDGKVIEMENAAGHPSSVASRLTAMVTAAATRVRVANRTSSEVELDPFEADLAALLERAKFARAAQALGAVPGSIADLSGDLTSPRFADISATPALNH